MNDRITKDDVRSIAQAELYDATMLTLQELAGQDALGRADVAMVRALLEVAERIDNDGLGCRVSLYERFTDMLRAVRRDQTHPDVDIDTETPPSAV